MNKVCFLMSAICASAIFTVGCDTGPSMGTDAEARETMDGTLTFDPMSSTQGEGGRPATP